MNLEQQNPAPWQRLSGRIIWVDLVQIIVTQLPLLVAILIMDSSPELGQLWPLIGLAVFGLLGAVYDAIRWIVTRYRVTPSYVEVKTGVLFRRRRSIQRDRIRSIDTEAKLRHRIAGLRVVTIGAGQQSTANEAALDLDALIAADAQALRQRLLTTEVRHAMAEPAVTIDDQEQVESEASDQEAPLQVFARFRPGWVVYNVFNIWAYAVALGLVGGTWWLLSTLNIDPTNWVIGVLDWQGIGWIGTTIIAFIAVGLVGVVGMVVSYFTEYWNFELARVRGAESTELRTSQGLFTTREVNRNEQRVRGFQLSQPLFWRWMGVTDTNVITTGLSLWSANQPAAILPRVPLKIARQITAEVMAPEASPFEVPLAKHPRAALRRRLWWATLTTLVLGVMLKTLVTDHVMSFDILWVIPVIWGLTLVGAVIAYHALGHTITGSYLVVRSGLWNRSTVALQRQATSTVVIRESVFQRRLGLKTVSVMTAAGYGGYDAPDIATNESLEFAIEAAPNILDDFLVEAAPSK